MQAKQETETAFLAFMKGLKAKFAALTDAEFTFKEAQKFYKVERRWYGQSSIYAFVDKQNGDIFKPASYKAPAKHARGSVFAQDGGLGCCNEFSVAYLEPGRKKGS
jgi:hypothetical protein